MERGGERPTFRRAKELLIGYPPTDFERAVWKRGKPDKGSPN